MNHQILVFLITLLCYSGFSQNQQQEIKEDFKPSSKNQPGQEYPQVNSQGYARFRIVAPAADSVRVSLGPASGTPDSVRVLARIDLYHTRIGATLNPSDR